jgi:hypothetical protein
MKKRFSIITFHIDSNRIRPFINECLCFDENNFKEIRKQLPKELKIAGFSSVRKLPFQSCSKLTSEILKNKLHIEPTVAKLLLKSWYSKHIAAIEAIKAILISLGYKINEPDFNSNRIEIQQLKVEDIYSTETLAYFRPNGHQIGGFNDEESTIAASLLGWVVIDSSGEDEEETENFEQNPEEISTSGVQEDLSESNDNRAGENTESSIDGADTEKIEKSIDETRNEELICEIEEIFKEHGAIFSDIAKNMSKGYVPEIEVLKKHVGFLELSLKHVASSLGIESHVRIDSVPQLKELYNNIVLQNAEIEKEKEIIYFRLSQIKAIKNRKNSSAVYLDKFKDLSNEYQEQLTKSDVWKNDWYQLMLANTHYLNLLVEIIELRNTEDPDDEILDGLLLKLKTKFIQNKFDFYDTLSTQINRGNIYIDDNIINVSIGKGGHSEIKDIEEETAVPIAIESENQSLLDEEISQEKEIDVEITSPTEKILPNDSPAPKTEKSSKIPEAEIAVQENSIQDTNKVPTEDAIVSKPEPEDISDEDRNILNLLLNNEPELAYHLAICYENRNIVLLLPSYLLKNLFLSLHVRTITGPVAQEIEPNYNKYNFVFEKSDKGHFINQMIFATILRPCFFAFESSISGILLNDLYAGKQGEFSEIKKLFNEFMSQNSGMLSYERLSQLNGQAQLKENKERFLLNIQDWIDRAQTDRYRNKPKHYHTQVFNNWVKKDGWINTQLNHFLKNQNGSILRRLITEDLEESAWEKKYQKELKSIAGNQKSALDNTEASRWFENNINSLKTLLEDGLSYFGEGTDNSFQHDETITANFINNILEEFIRISKALSTFENDNIFNKVAVKYINKAISNIDRMLKGSCIELEQPPIDRLINTPLLKLPYYESDINWNPIEYNDSLAEMILAFANNPQKSYDQIVSMHLISGNIEALTKLISAKVIDEGSVNSTMNIPEFSDQLKFDLQKARTEIERGCALGYVLNGQRDSLFSAIIEIEEKNKITADGINYPLRKAQIEQIVNFISTLKDESVKQSKSSIPDEIRPEFRGFLIDTLSKGNILVFNESIDRIKAGQFVLAEDKSNIFRNFFHDFLKHESSIDINQVLKSVRNKSEYKSVDFGNITEFQAKEAELIISEWQFVKRTELTGDQDGFLKVKKFLDYFGFVSAELELTDRYKKTLYFDFTCTPIKGRSQSPLPQYGSVAQGKYRLIIFRDRITEEDQLELIKALIPITNRPVLVFNFFYLNHKNRLSLAKLSRKSKTTFLQLDEAMLIFLTSVKESKLPAFIKLAAPFTFAEPYQTASSNLPEEMFYGRASQIRKLVERIGDFSCLIYGGRQLGKTVLQREVERIFNQPDKGYYAIYIDLRESGIGTWRPIEELTAVLFENLNIIPGLLPDKYSANAGLNFLLNKIKEWIDRNKESRIILFLDESDKFLEKDSLKEWPHVLPLKGLMEKTDKRFKVVLAGLHDVRRTIKIPNNPLAHFGNPICVGPMLEKEEATEAQMLIKLPFETLGAEFKSDDLVFMILSHCNWYPSLIQIFCSKLLNVIFEKRQINDLPIIITAEDITTAYERSRELIKEKFNLTLGLDERYDLLANIIASETINNPSIYTQGLSVEYISEMATLYWPEGFESTNTKVEVQNLLEEMVDLGILRIEPTGRAALRTPNLLGLIGDEKQINDNLAKERKIPTEFKRETSRIIYSVGTREVRSPFPAFYYDKLIDPESKVVVLRGSKMGGIQYVSEFLKSRKKEVNLIIPEFDGPFETDSEEIWKSIDKKRVTGKHNLVLFEESKNYNFDSIHKTMELFEGKSSLTAVFLIDSANLWDILSKYDKSFERLENLKVQIFNIPQWHKDVVSDWFRETGCLTAEIPEIFNAISYWHKLLDEYHKAIIESPEIWQEKLNEFQRNLETNKSDLFADFGLFNQELIASIRELNEWDGSISREEYIDDNTDTETLHKKEMILDYFTFLNLIDGKLMVNNFIKSLLKDE